MPPDERDIGGSSGNLLNWTHAALPAAPGVARAYAHAVEALPAYLADLGYDPLGIAVLQFVQFYEVDFGALFAGLVIVMLPTLVCYVVLQEQITKGITVGAVKG